MDGSTLQHTCNLRSCTFRKGSAGQAGWQTRGRQRCRSSTIRPRCEQGAAWLGDSDLLRLKVGGRNDHGPLNMGPKLQLSLEDAVEMQLQALQKNNEPHADHGIEVLYRFTNFDPFERTRYFGRALDLGQFERFRRIFHTPFYAVLLNHQDHETLSSLQVSEYRWRRRVVVTGHRGQRHGGQGIFQFHMLREVRFNRDVVTREAMLLQEQRLGGRWDGFWYTDSLIAEGTEDYEGSKTLICM